MASPIQELMAVLFLSRDYAHKMHLASKSYSQHVALNDFYHDIIDDADALAEAWQGKNATLIGEIPSGTMDTTKDPAKALQDQLDAVESYRKEVTKGYSPLENRFDEIAETYLSAIYKLTFLK